ncbi:HAMP domain-containing histidine kinase [Marinobacter daepoensis]|uniref:histidine kinase n=1 Tax=Marinobacter daepoensis TaxID=262077 RepID=A0ABS3B8Z6_9GAMM|nr:HAMP domain-containing sensor histidine kinase [Marinobacter daepoensis]MBN7768330.1 HAMP domain-containing histidine kinase [Marinobacter daepoensis]MBY6080631.1 HAMP domain-containing histidine kinase [Marinobacter daepoensis]
MARRFMTTERTPARKQVLFHLPLLAAVLIVPLLVGTLIYVNRMTSENQIIQNQQDRMLGIALSLIHSQLGDMSHTLYLLANDRLLRKALSEQPIDRDSAHEVFFSFNTAIDSLTQIRWLSPSGMEQVRVDLTDQGGVPTPEHRLQDKSQRYYFINGINTPPGEIYFSPLDLNVEWGEIVIPFEPTIRITLKTGEQNQMPPGLLVINYNLARLMEDLRQLNTNQVQLMIVNPNGYWTLHPDRDKEWGAQREQPGNTLARISPKFWNQLKTQEVMAGHSFYDGIVSSQVLHVQPLSKTINAYLLAMTPRALVQEMRLKAAGQAAAVALVLLVIGGIVLWREYRQQRTMMGLNAQLAEDKKALEQAGKRQKDLMSQQQLLQQDLVQASKLSSLGMMVAGVAHELNTPIGGAMLAVSRQQRDLEALQQGFDEGLSRSAFLTYLEDTRHGNHLLQLNLGRCAELVRSFKRLAVDRANEEIIEFSPRQVAEDLLISLEPELKQHSVVIEDQIEADLSLESYPGVLSQVLQNLLTNALDHGFEPSEPGRITLSTQAEPGQQRLAIIVEDNGRGISPDIRPRIFDPFVTSRRGRGNTGLGLNLVHQWVTQVLEGDIEVASPCKDGRGTRFTLWLPLAIERVDVT